MCLLQFAFSYSLPQVPPAIANGIYSQIEGAKLRNVSGLGAVWTLSCDKEVNVTFKIGGEKYLIHPLDTTIEASDLGLEIDICIGAVGDSSYLYTQFADIPFLLSFNLSLQQRPIQILI